MALGASFDPAAISLHAASLARSSIPVRCWLIGWAERHLKPGRERDCAETVDRDSGASAVR